MNDARKLELLEAEVREYLDHAARGTLLVMSKAQAERIAWAVRMVKKTAWRKASVKGNDDAAD